MNDVADVPGLVVRRRISATRAELFDAWLDPEALAVWMRPGSARRTTARAGWSSPGTRPTRGSRIRW